MLTMALHPGIVQLAERARSEPLPRLVEVEFWSSEEVLLDAFEDHRASLPGWDALRLIGGEIAEVYLQSPQSDMAPGEPLLVSGRFLNGMLFQASYLPNQTEARCRWSLVTAAGRPTLSFPQGWPGPAERTERSGDSETRTETFAPFHPWAVLIERFEEAVEESLIRRPTPGQPSNACLTQTPSKLGWQDELRALELDDAARRSADRGRSQSLDLQETSEETTFKGTMTLVGCSLIWLSVIVLIVSAWFPMAAWLIVPLFGVFLLLQTLRWIMPPIETKTPSGAHEPAPAIPVRKSTADETHIKPS
jgi:hypothetical protein